MVQSIDARCSRSAAALISILALAVSFVAKAEKVPVGYTDTPFLPDSRWRVHDPERPHPPVIAPGTVSSDDLAGKPPSDAVILFDGQSLAAWRKEDGGAPGWKVESGYMEVVRGSGNLVTKEQFGDSQLHIEFRSPSPPTGASQGRGNSGVFLFGLYEVQVLDSYDNVTYADGQASAIYGQSPPLVNASRPPGQWQVYDIVYTGPRFKDGKIEIPAYVTVLHNGVVTQNHTQVLGATMHRVLPKTTVHGPAGPIKLQDHGDPVQFRNIWIRSLR
jgi:hypothetical protein